MQSNERVADLLIQKFVTEEIMTKSEFQLSLDQMMDRRDAAMASKFQTKEAFQLSIDRIMDKHEASIDAKFHMMETKIDNRYNWLTGIIITSVIGIIGIGIKIMSMIPH